MKKVKLRESNIELLRLVLMFFIVFYHILFFYASPEAPQVVIYKALQIPLHVAVVCFVLISGYFGINVSSNGLLKLLVPLFFYYIPPTLLMCLYMNYAHGVVFGVGEVLKCFQAITQGPYWFVRSYLYLFLLSPMINNYLTIISGRDRILLIVSLAFMCWYIPLQKCDNFLMDPYNVINFIFLYVIGNTLKTYSKYIDKVRTLFFVLGYSFLNVGLVLLFTYGINIPNVIWDFAYEYNMPILTINAVLLFLIFRGVKIKNNMVNKVAESSFAIYIIHHQPQVLSMIIGPLSLFILHNTSSSIVAISCFMLLTGFVVFASIVIDLLTKNIQRKIISVLSKLLAIVKL